MKIQILITIKNPGIKIILVIYAGNIKQKSKSEKNEIICNNNFCIKILNLRVKLTCFFIFKNQKITELLRLMFVN